MGGRRHNWLLVATCVMCGAAPARAQIAPPEFKSVNDQSVNVMTFGEFNLMSGTLDLTEPLLEMNGADGGITFKRYLSKMGPWRHNLQYSIDSTDLNNISVILGDELHVFSGSYPYTTIAGTNYIGDGQGNALGAFISGGFAYFKYIGRDGTEIIFDGPFAGAVGSASSVKFPSGLVRTYYYKTATVGSDSIVRIQSIVQNDGTLVKFSYDTSDSSNSAGWLHVSSVSLVNQSYVYCDPAADSCGLSAADWPTATFSGPPLGAAPSGQTAIETTTTSTGYGRSYKRDSVGRVTGISYVQPYTEDLTFSYIGSTYRISQVTNGRGESRGYTASANVDFSLYTGSISSSTLGINEYYYFDSSAEGMPAKIVNRNNQTTLYAWTGHDRHLAKVTHPEGNFESYQYDSRFNVTAKTMGPKTGSVSSSISEHASYDANCNNINTCNQPNSYIDKNSNETDWTYTSFGRIASQLSPPAAVGAPRRLKLYTYVQKSAYVKNSSGALTSTSQPIWLLASEVDCQTAAGSSALACDASAVRTDTVYMYGADGTADSLLTRGQAVTSNGRTLVTCFGYDRIRHRISTTLPNANLQVCS